MSSSYYIDQPPPAASAMAAAAAGGWNPHQLEYHQPHHPHAHPHHPPPYYQNPYFAASHFMPQPQTPQPLQTSQTPHSDAVQQQPQQPLNTESVGEAGSGLSDSYEKQPTPSESASSRSPTASNTASTPLSDLALRMGSFNTEAIAAEAAAMQAATLAAASYDMYGGQTKVAPGTGSPSSFYPWMKNYNSKLTTNKTITFC